MCEMDKPVEEMTDDELLAALAADITDITNLRHVRARVAAEEIATHSQCADFARFAPLFEAVRRDLDTGARRTQLIRDAGVRLADIQAGEFFILGGQLTYVASVGARLRVIYANGTECDLLLRSLQRALHKDKASRYVLPPSGLPSLTLRPSREILIPIRGEKA